MSNGANVYNPTEILRRIRCTADSALCNLPDRSMTGTPVNTAETHHVPLRKPPTQKQSMVHTIGHQTMPISEVSQMNSGYQTTLEQLDREKQLSAQVQAEIDELRTRLDEMESERKLMTHEVTEKEERIMALADDNKRLTQEVASLRALVPSKLESIIERANTMVGSLAAYREAADMRKQQQAAAPAPAQPPAQPMMRPMSTPQTFVISTPQPTPQVGLTPQGVSVASERGVGGGDTSGYEAQQVTQQYRYTFSPTPSEVGSGRRSPKKLRKVPVDTPPQYYVGGATQVSMTLE